MNTRFCDMCGKPLKAGVQMGGAIVCRDCDPELQAEIKKTREAGNAVNALHIAKRIYKEVHKPGSYLLRDIPPGIWNEAKHAAIDQGVSLRDFLLLAIHAQLKKGKD